MENWFRGNDEGSADSLENRDPIVDDPTCEGLEISRVPFSELIKVFPNTAQVILFSVSMKMHLKLNVHLFSRAKHQS
jgi:hypothetical protein